MVVELALELLDVLEQDRDRARHRIGQIAVIEVDELEPAGAVHAVAAHDAARNADDGRVAAAPAWITTEPAPMRLAAPIVTGPSTVAPVVMTT